MEHLTQFTTRGQWTDVQLSIQSASCQWTLRFSTHDGVVVIRLRKSWVLVRTKNGVNEATFPILAARLNAVAKNDPIHQATIGWGLATGNQRKEKFQAKGSGRKEGALKRWVMIPKKGRGGCVT